MLRNSAFTLIELLVVIVIIGLLAGIGIASFQGSIRRGQTAKVQSDLKEFKDAIVVAQLTSGKRLQDITGNGCSACTVCWGAGDLRNVPTTNSCYTRWINAVTTVQAATGGSITDIDNIKRDPWGSPYWLDENEREFGPTDCRLDTIASAGPDGLAGTGDDISVRPPLSKRCP